MFELAGFFARLSLYERLTQEANGEFESTFYACCDSGQGSDEQQSPGDLMVLAQEQY